jgi:hypothetical protein
MDKKRVDAGMNYILLETIGKGIIKQIPVDDLKQYLVGFNKINKG